MTLKKKSSRRQVSKLDDTIIINSIIRKYVILDIAFRLEIKKKNL